jgi:hypothetical protein
MDGIRKEPFRSYYQRLVSQGMRPEMARLTLARKIVSVTLTLWKKGERFDELKLRQPVA